MHEQKRYNIAVLIGAAHTYYPKLLIHGICDAAQEQDVNVYFFPGAPAQTFFQGILGTGIENFHDYQFHTLYDYSLLSGFDGAIIDYGTIGPYRRDCDANAFIEKFNAFPIVVLSEPVDLPNCHYLLTENYRGMTLLMQHLIRDHGYRRILYISGPEHNMDASERKQAYLDAMAEAALPVDDSMIVGGDYNEFIDTLLEDLLDRHPDAEALVFANDEMALAGYRVCERRGLKVGRDIAITGFDDCDLSCNLTPPLTTVRQDGLRIGRQALLELLEKLKGQSTVSRRLPVNYIQRESCGCSSAALNSEDTVDSLNRKCRFLSEKLFRITLDAQTDQRKSWFAPYFAHNLANYTSDEEQFCRRIMANLQYISSRNMFLFLLPSPIFHKEGNCYGIPEQLCLASCQQNGKILSYPPDKRPAITRFHCMDRYLNDEETHQYTFFLLFSGEMQYGLLACDIDQTDFSFYYMISLQISQSLHYLEISKIENAHIEDISRDMERIHEQNRELNIISNIDKLTGLLNRHGIFEQFEKKLQSCKIPCSAYMIYADLDHLKEINDTWGHAEGDFAIQSAAQILRDCIRETDICGRIGGDEFLCLVCSESASFEQNFRERITQICRTFNADSGKPYYVELSLGILAFECTPDAIIDEIISQADALLYENKRCRRRSVQKHPGSLHSGSIFVNPS